MAGAKVVSVPLQPPKSGMTKTHSAGEWTLDIAAFRDAVTPRTRMLVLNTPREHPPNPPSVDLLLTDSTHRQPPGKDLHPQGAQINCRRLRSEQHSHHLR